MKSFSWGFLCGVLALAGVLFVAEASRSCSERFFDAPRAHRPESER